MRYGRKVEETPVLEIFVPPCLPFASKTWYMDYRLCVLSSIKYSANINHNPNFPELPLLYYRICFSQLKFSNPNDRSDGVLAGGAGGQVREPQASVQSIQCAPAVRKEGDEGSTCPRALDGRDEAGSSRCTCGSSVA